MEVVVERRDDRAVRLPAERRRRRAGSRVLRCGPATCLGVLGRRVRHVTGYGRALLGLSRRDSGGGTSDREDALDVLMLLRLSEPAFPPDLLPIEILPERQLHCVVVGGHAPGRVVLIDLDRPDVRVAAALNLQDFVWQWQQDLHAMAAVVTEVLGSDESDEAVLLRPDEWSTRRLCSQNVIVAILQTRHNRDTNEHDVAVCATASLTSFAAGAALAGH